MSELAQTLGIYTGEPNQVTSLADAITEAKAQIRGNKLVLAGLSTKTHDPTRLTDRDVDRLVAAAAKRRQKLAKARDRAR